MKQKFDVLIVGAGILGIAHALACLKKGLSVAIFEKNSRPRGATVRNFGQIVPSGFASKWQKYGRRSLEIYQHIQDQTDVSLRQQGSIYLASTQAELGLLEELREINLQNDYTSKLLTKNQCLEKYTGLKSSYVKGGLFFPQEVNLDPMVAADRIMNYLLHTYNLTYFPNNKIIRTVKNTQQVKITSSSGDSFFGEKLIICCGTDFETLFPEKFRNAGIQKVKLQMLNTVPLKDQRINGSILTGRTIRRYESFHECPSFPIPVDDCNDELFARKYGIHILFKQGADGRVILGDSHEYFSVTKNEDGGIYNTNFINEFMINEAKAIFDLETWEIERTWIGYYAQCENRDIYLDTIDEDIHIVAGIGGKGMTASLGFAEENIKNII